MSFAFQYKFKNQLFQKKFQLEKREKGKEVGSRVGKL